MYDKSDPRSRLAAAPKDTSGTTAFPATYGLYYEEPPVDDDANGKSWYTRSQNLIVHYSETKPGARFSRKGQLDEYMIVLPDENTPYEVTANGETKKGEGYQLIITPPGHSEVRLPNGGRVVRLFTTQSADLCAKCSNAETYAEGDPSHPPFQAWPAPPDGFKLRVYDLQKERKPGELGPIWRCTTIMLNFPPPSHTGPRDPTKMSPHSHYDFDQCSLVLAGSFVHHMRWPWGLNKNDWKPDEHILAASPSATMIPARVIHTSENQKPVGPEGNRMADIFSPPRLDFSLQPGWIKNADEYPLPEVAAQ